MKYLIHDYSSNLDRGLFGMVLPYVIEVIYFINAYDKDMCINFNIDSLLYGNVIPGHIIPKDICEISEYTVSIELRKFKDDHNIIGLGNNINDFLIANEIWNKHFDISDTIKNQIKDIDAKTTLGIHYRGTDKNYDTHEANYITIDEFIIITKDFLRKNSNITTLYCCSDEEEFIKQIKIFFGSYKIEYHFHDRNINYGDDVGIHEKNTTYEEKNKNITSALIDMYNLSKCGVVLKTSSALSVFCKIINPSQQIYTVSAVKQMYWPTFLVECWKSDSNEVNEILKRTMEGDILSEKYSAMKNQ
jgi:hypothetical protein